MITGAPLFWRHRHCNGPFWKLLFLALATYFWLSYSHPGRLKSIYGDIIVYPIRPVNATAYEGRMANPKPRLTLARKQAGCRRYDMYASEQQGNFVAIQIGTVLRRFAPFYQSSRRRGYRRNETPNCRGQLVKRSHTVSVPKAVFPKERIYSIEGEFLREEPEEP